jgi:hypothetical protein
MSEAVEKMKARVASDSSIDLATADLTLLRTVTDADMTDVAKGIPAKGQRSMRISVQLPSVDPSALDWRVLNLNDRGGASQAFTDRYDLVDRAAPYGVKYVGRQRI